MDVDKAGDKNFIVGYRRMFGSTIVRTAKERGHTNVANLTRAQLRPTNQAKLNEFFTSEKLTQVYLVTAKVRDIHENKIYLPEFIRQKLMVWANVFDIVSTNGAHKLFLSTIVVLMPSVPSSLCRVFTAA